MKRNSLLVFGVAMLAMTFAACSEELNNESEPALVKDGGKAVTVVVSDHGFDNATPATRATDSNEETIEDNKTVMTTEFAVGDQIGVFAINSQTNIVVNDNYVNMKLTKQSNGTWAPPSGKEFLYYQGVDYFAYYPYKEGLTINDVDLTNHTAEGFFHDYIAAFTPEEDQSTLAKYTKSDLMVGQGSLVGTECQFQMKHVMGLMVIQVPTVNYTYRQVDDETNVYNVKEFYTIDKSNKAVFQIDKGEPYYRYIVRPNASELLTGKTFPNYDDGKYNVFAVSHTGVDGGYYKKYVVDNAAVTNVERTFKPGDIFYQDGTITDPKVDFKTAIGYVAYCGQDEVTLDNDPNETEHKQWHGVVIATAINLRLNSLSSNTTTYNANNLNPNGLCFGDITLSNGYPTPSADSQTFVPECSQALADFGGIWKTRFMWDYRCSKSWRVDSSTGRAWGNFNGIAGAKDRTKPYSELCETSNFFIPTFGEMVRIFGPKGIGGGDKDALEAQIQTQWTAGGGSYPTSTYSCRLYGNSNVTTITSNMIQAASKAGVTNGAIVLSQFDKVYFAQFTISATAIGMGYYTQLGTSNADHWCCIAF